MKRYAVLVIAFALLGVAASAQTKFLESTSSNGLIIGTGVSSPTSERVRVTQSGNVGISNTNPIAKLDVVGTISASDAIQVSGSALTCNSGLKGAIRYSNTSSTIEYCQGTAWVSVGPSDTAVPAFLVHKNGTNQTVSSGTWTKLTWSAEAFDTYNNFSSDRFTPTVAGYYLLTLQAYCSNSTDHCTVGIQKNGAYINQRIMRSSAFQSGNAVQLVWMNGSTDYVEGFVYTTGTTIDGGTHTTSFAGTLIASGNGSAGGGGATPAGSAGDIQFNDGSNLAADTGQLFWDATNNRLGIGTTAPIAPLHVSSTSSGSIVDSAIFGNNATGVNGTGARIYLTGNNNTARAGYIEGGIMGGGANGHYLALGTSANGSVPTERFRIDSSGKVGIGTTTPLYALDVSGTVRGRMAPGNVFGLIASNYNGSGGAFVADTILGGTPTYNYFGNYQPVPLVFITSNSERVRITQDGNVGIGTGSPGRTLEIRDTNKQLRLSYVNTYTDFHSFDAGTGADAYLDINPQPSADTSASVVRLFRGVSTTGTVGLAVVRGDGSSALNGLISGNSTSYLNAITGNVGIGKTAPAAKLDVNGTVSASDAIQVGSSSLTCNSGLKGALRYSNVSGTIEYCQGTAWMNVAAADGGVYASYYSNAAQSVPNNAFTTVTAFGNKKFDSGSAFNGTTFTAPVAGVYSFHAQTGFVNIAGGTIIGSRFLKNGATVFGYNSTRSTNTAADVNVGSDALIQLAANDTVVFQAWQVTGSAQNTRNDASSFFDVYGPVDANAGSGSGGGGATPAGSAGDIQFNDGSNLAADTGQLFWDATNNRFGIGTAAPIVQLDVRGQIAVSGSTASLAMFDRTVGVGTSQWYRSAGKTHLWDSDSNSQRISIDNGTGYVGIGTSSPGAPLDVSGTGLFLRLRSAQYGTIYAGADAYEPWFGTQTNNDIRVITSSTEKVRIEASGNVGIGTAAPTAKLQVQGTISASDAIQVGSSSLTCNSGLKGAMRYSNTSSTIEYCQGTAWVSMGPSSTEPVAFSVYRSSNQTGLTSGSANKVLWTSELFDTNANFASSRFTASVPGKYLVNAGILCSSATTYCAVLIYKNGSSVAQNFARGSDHSSSVSTIVDLSVNDYLEVYAQPGGGTILDGAADRTFFNGVLLAPQGGSGSGGGATPAGSAGDIQFNDGSNLAADTGQLFWNAASNRLGIGTDTPLGSLHVSGSVEFGGTGTSIIEMGRNSVGNQYSIIDMVGDDTYTDYGLRIMRGNTGPDANSTVYHHGLGAFGIVTQEAAPIRFYTSNTFRVSIEPDGDVGIGTSTPSAKLDVQGQISSTGGITAGYANSHGQFRAVGAGYGTILRNDGVNTYLLLTAAGDPLGTWNSLRPFQLVNATGNLNLGNGALYVNHGGNVGIGTPTANAELTFGSDAADINLDTADAADIGYLGLSGGGASSWSRGASIFMFGNENANTGNLELQAGNVAGGDIVFSAGGAERARMTYGGNVGIGTGAPAAKLQVQGTISASDAVQVGASSLTCNSGLKGAMRYSTAKSVIEYCQGTAWVSMGASATDVPAFSVHKNGTNQTVTSNQWIKLTWNTERFDTYNNFSSDRFTPTVPGKYIFSAVANCNGATGYCATGIYKNSSMYAQANNALTGGTYNVGGLVTAIVDMNGTTDYVEAYVYSTNGVVLGSSSDTHFSGSLIASGNGLAANSPAGDSGDIQFNNGGALGADTGQLFWDGTNDRLGIGTNNPTAAGLGWTSWGNPKVGLVSSGDGLNIRIDGPNNPLNLWKKTGTAGGFVSFSFGTTRSDVGNIYTNGTTTSYNTTSDGRLKTHIRPTALGLDEVMRIEVDDFVFRDDPSKTVETGFIAQELMKIFPGAVTTNGDDGVSPLKPGNGAWSVDYGRVTPLLVKSVQELKAANDNIRAENALLRKELEEIKRRVGM